MGQNKDEKKVDSIIDDSIEEMDEADKILKELDEIEKKKEKDISSKVRDLIKSDKEAIRDYTAKREKNKQKESEMEENDTIETDSDVELNVFIEYESEEGKNRNIQSKKKERRATRNKKQQSIDKKNSLSEYENDKTEPEEERTEEEAEKEDFLGSLDKRTKHIVNERIRKKQPNRLKPKDNTLQTNTGFISNIRSLAMAEIKNTVVFISIIALTIILFAAMILDRNHLSNEKNQGAFLEMDTTGIVSLFNDYYTALANNDINKAKEYLEESSDLSDDILLEKVKETQVYKEQISDSFKIVHCYLQKGLKENEYIAYFKFELKFKEVETPAVGIFSSYVVNCSVDKEKQDYKICNVDKMSDRYKHMARMSNCSNVTEVFKQTDKELMDACEKDAALKKVVDVLRMAGKNESETTTAETGSSENNMESVTVSEEMSSVNESTTVAAE
ncbi:MAG: hypothetical protein HFI34_01095 [Lachnospiraceae bacterium]|nr:hypothetical protein [Lachnospiraceae bacterium]